jgi:hypothetical protein
LALAQRSARQVEFAQAAPRFSLAQNACQRIGFSCSGTFHHCSWSK